MKPPAHEAGARRPGRPAGKRKKSSLDSLSRRASASACHSGWFKYRSRSSNWCCSGRDGDNAIEELGERREPVEEAPVLPNVTKFELIARNLWLPDYDELFELERAENEQLLGAASSLPPSSYRARLKGEAAI